MNAQKCTRNNIMKTCTFVAVLKGEAQLPSESCKRTLTIVVTSPVEYSRDWKVEFRFAVVGLVVPASSFFNYYYF